MDLLAAWDQALVRFINEGWFSPIGDTIAHVLSARATWWSAALLALAFIGFRRSRRHAVTMLLIGISIAASDLACAQLLKPAFARPRPCHQMMLHIYDGCGGVYGFPSNHAANAAAVATVVALRLPGPWGFAAGVLAFLVGLSRIYLGVHFPTDVLAGFALGSALSTLLVWLAHRRDRRAPNRI